MGQPIILKIDVTKLKKEWFFTANSGAKYADLVLYENDAEDKFGNSHAIKQNPPKEARDSGEKGHYVGNGKWMGQRSGGQQRQQSSGQQRPASGGQRRANVPPQGSDGDMEDDDIPFNRPHYLTVGGW